MLSSFIRFVLVGISLSNLQAAAHVFASLTSGSTSISRINGVSGEQSHVYPTIPGVETLSVSRDGLYALIVAPSSNSVALVDLRTGSIKYAVALSGTPLQSFFSADGRIVYVLGSDAPATTLHLFAIGAASGTVLTDIRYPSIAGDNSNMDSGPGYAVSPDGRTLYFMSGITLSVFRLPSLALASSTTVGHSSPDSVLAYDTVAATSDGNYLVLGGNTVSGNDSGGYIAAVYTTRTYEKVSDIVPPGAIYSLLGAPDSGSVYAIIRTTDSVSLYTIAVPSLGFSPGPAVPYYNSFAGMAISPDGARLLAGEAIFDLPSGAVEVPVIGSLSGTVQGQFDRAGNIWVVNEYSTEIAVLDQGSSTVSALIPVGASGIIAPGLPGVLYFLSGNDIDTIDVLKRRITRSTPVPAVQNAVDGMAFLAVSAGKVFVGGGGELDAYDQATGQLTSISLTQLNGSETILIDLLIAPDGKYVFAGLYGESICPDCGQAGSPSDSGAIDVIDTSTGATTKVLGVGPVGGIALSAEGILYVATSDGDAQITAIDLTGNPGVKVFTFPKIPTGFSSLLISPDGGTLYALGSYNPVVSVIRASDGTLLNTYPGGTTDATMALSPDGTTLYLSNLLSNALPVIDTASGAQTTVDVGSPTASVATSKW